MQIPSTDELQKQLAPLVGLAWRVVETQETAATRAISRNAEEQLRLEQLLDTSKPPVPSECERLSYLLMTPFRYPPLQYGSRYGGQWERGIFYAAKEKQTALAETAVYLWLFQKGPTITGPLAEISDSRTLFSVRLRTQKGCDLCSSNFAELHPSITNPKDWQHSQQLGTNLRQAGAEFFWYPSSRRPEGTNVAVLKPECFATTKPDKEELWNLRLTEELCWFGRAGGDYYEFSHTAFKRAGVLQHPCL
ncbi:RES family NAD+ phosphorylase [Teredinibacter haidensis]|uniref:RES family NAD+ phosphorylase n=1 Tax=Teredinibacter haidensis TaxID=2731755 RepID=UPI000948FFB9|nr:RES family NAD+ phosphorylase [Teredinibacter haidensis]